MFYYINDNANLYPGGNGLFACDLQPIICLKTFNHTNRILFPQNELRPYVNLEAAECQIICHSRHIPGRCSSSRCGHGSCDVLAQTNSCIPCNIYYI